MVRDLKKEGWREVDVTKECFMIDELPPEKAFLSLNIPLREASLFQIFHKFVDDRVMNDLYSALDPDELVMEWRSDLQPKKKIDLKMWQMWETFAIQVRIIGNQQKSCENEVVERPLKKSLNEARSHFRNKFFVEPIRLHHLQRLVTILLFGDNNVNRICRNFQSTVHHLGQYIAGDEKLFHYTGESGCIRLVPSKPDRIGLWFYECCGTFRNGSPFILYMKLHNNYLPGTQKLTNVVQDWGSIVINSGVGDLPSSDGNIPSSKNPQTYLVFDSLYFDKATREYLKNANIHYTCSVKSDRAKEEIKFATQEMNDTPGEYRSIYNSNTQELFTYAYDPDVNVGKKFNMSRGWTRSEMVTKIREWKDTIPGYDPYKSMFQACDRFNRNLHDKVWPHIGT